MFSESKTTQAASYLIGQAGGSMNYMVLIKMLYAADRDSLLQRGRPITWDDFVSMTYGPVLSRTHDLITEMPDPHQPNVWKNYIAEPSNYKVNLVSDPGVDELSENEVAILGTVFDRYKQYLSRPFDLVKQIHKEFPEVIEVERGRQYPLSLDDVLTKNQIPEQEKDAILDEINGLQADCRTLARR